MEFSLSPSEIIEIIQASTTRGSTTEMLHGIASLQAAHPGELSFLGNSKYKPEVAATAASIVLLPLDYVGEPKPNQLFLLLEKPSLGLARLCGRLEQMLWPKPTPGIHTTAVIAPDAQIPASATIGPLCVIESGAVIGERTHVQAQAFIGRKARIGADCWLKSGVKIATECVLGNRVLIHDGAVIGADGFGYEFVAGRHQKVPQVGRVVIHDDVEIGANATLDRARFSETVIGEGTKIDNLVQVGHNVVVGKHCLLCAQVGFAGSTTLEDYVVIGGQAGIAGHITIGRGCKIDGQTGVNSSLEPGSSVKGSPCLPYSVEQRINVVRKRLPELFKRVDALEEALNKPSANA
ncbi:MAG: UDP-3-O-(3-hydroxymyristoyl)glucosamine N-acyltransferase [Verrucomicrobia bacterium]|nr:UDP-3-O-(3-hydroxymyristoyl)glucosamine N-acyltransferase [Verrucomicrobiota bacterium]